MASQEQVKARPEPGNGLAKAIHMRPSQEFFDPPAKIADHRRRVEKLRVRFRARKAETQPTAAWPGPN